MIADAGLYSSESLVFWLISFLSKRWVLLVMSFLCHEISDWIVSILKTHLQLPYPTVMGLNVFLFPFI